LQFQEPGPIPALSGRSGRGKRVPSRSCTPEQGENDAEQEETPSMMMTVPQLNLPYSVIYGHYYCRLHPSKDRSSGQCTSMSSCRNSIILKKLQLLTVLDICYYFLTHPVIDFLRH